MNLKDQKVNQCRAHPVRLTHSASNLKHVKESYPINLFARNIFGTLLFIASFFISSASTVEKASGSDIKGFLIEKYVESAFHENSALIKFSSVPKILSICSDTKRCAKLHWYMRSLMPKEISVAFSSSIYDPQFDIIILYRSDFLSGTDTVLKTAINEIKDAVELRDREYVWGNNDCRVHQFRNENTIKKLLIEVNSNASYEFASACLIFELMRGTGANFQTDRFEDYAPKIATLKPNLLDAMHKGVKAILRVHLSTVLSPGMTVNEAKDQLKKSLDN